MVDVLSNNETFITPEALYPDRHRIYAKSLLDNSLKPHALSTGDVLSYDAIHPLGKGELSVIVPGTLEKEGMVKEVAVKIFMPVKGHEQDNEKFTREFETEKELLSTIDHPNIVKFLGKLKIGGLKGIVLERLQKIDFSEKDSNQKLKDTSDMVSQIAEALQVLVDNDEGLLVTDISDENIMRRDNGEFVLIDFVRKGKNPLYAPPELSVIGHENEVMQRATPRSQVYSLGMVANKMLGGELASEVDMSFGKFEPRKLTVPEEVNEVVKKALSPDIANRYSDPVVFAEELNKTINH